MRLLFRRPRTCAISAVIEWVLAGLRSNNIELGISESTLVQRNTR